jgi:uncharacterized protein YkwD
MFIRAALCSLALGAAFPAHAQDGTPSAEFLHRATQWMQSSEPSRQKAACRSFLQLGSEAMPAYEKALDAALRHHSKALDDLGRGRGNAANPYAAHAEQAKQLEEERSRVLGLIRTDWNKSGEKIRMLREEMETLARLHKRVRQLAATDTKQFDQLLDGSVHALAEFTRERLRFHPDEELEAMDDEELRQHVLADNLEGQQLITDRRLLEATRAEASRFKEVTQANSEADRWATAAIKDFASTLNAERDVTGLTPLRLEEKLSAAAAGHSADMARLGFFAHESPVEGKKSPWDRARLAGFQGNASGENIFAGSASPAAAYHGWFGSDGHRFIMFGQGPNVLGVGVSGSHWTMMTGSR